MKLSCTQENLNQGLFTVGHIAARNANLPILGNILLKAKDGVLKLLATNLEIGITCQVRGKIEEDGDFTLPAKLFADYIGLLPNEKVDLGLKGNDLEIKCGKAKTKIRGQEAADFPLIPEVEKKNPYLVGANDFLGALGQVIFAVAKGDTRPELGGVYFNFNSNNLTMAATDSYRLAERTIGFKNQNGQERAIIVPASTLLELTRIIAGTKKQEEKGEAEDKGRVSGELEIYLSENQVLFSFNNIEVVSRTIEGQYPNYKQIIPTEHKTRTVFKIAELGRAVKTASLFSKAGIFDVGLNFSPGKNEVEISAANAQLGESNMVVEAELEGEENNIVVNYRYLLDGLQNINEEEVIFEMSNNASPCLLRPAREGKAAGEYFYIVMPIKQ